MSEPVQQDDNYKEFMTWITDGGLRYAVARHQGEPPGCDEYRTMVDPANKRNIIIVGSGMAGLSAAYELAQIGHEVKILEMNGRVGGRVRTLREGFQDGLHIEAGAMRLPPNHYLTKHYIDLFEIEPRKFQNYQEKGYMYLFGDKIKMKEFRDRNGLYSDKYWPGWDSNIITRGRKKRQRINGILSYFDATLDPVRKDLGANPSNKRWRDWVDKWSRLSIADFLRSNNHQDPRGPQLRPWPEEAIQGLKTFTYSVSLDVSLVWYMREDLGNWWGDDLYTPKKGMDTLPKSFTQPNDKGWNKDVYLEKNIVYGRRVEKIELTVDTLDLGQKVRVYGVNTATGATEVFNGDVVFVTVPLPILRQIDVPLTIAKQKAIADVTISPTTKILLQCRTRFWQKDVGQGGFSKTNLMIGQLHYPDYDGSGIPDTDRGILVVYTWFDNALSFGAETNEQAIKVAVREIAKIHPEIEHEFEFGQVQAWNNDPSALGAFTTPKSFEYIDSMQTLTKPDYPIYLAGEAISWSEGWIQGALFSSLLQAFFFQNRVEGHGDVDPMIKVDN